MTIRGNRNINYIFGILTSRAIDLYINESILRGSGGGGGGGPGNLGGGSRFLLGHFHEIFDIVFGILSSSPVDWHPCWVMCDVIKGGGSGSQKCMECPQCICMIEIKKVLWQRFWLFFCTKEVVSARACTN